MEFVVAFLAVIVIALFIGFLDLLSKYNDLNRTLEEAQISKELKGVDQLGGTYCERVTMEVEDEIQNLQSQIDALLVHENLELEKVSKGTIVYKIRRR